MKLGVLPRFHESAITDPAWVEGFAAVCEEVGVESVSAVEHVLVARDYEPRYSYSADGPMPGSYRYGSAFDRDLAQACADLGVTRFVVSAQEASGDSFDDIRRFLGDYREQVLDRL